jgi:hypothetical protein
MLCVLLLVALIGCSRTEIAYRNADWLVARWAAGLLDPETAQASAWEGVLERAMQTHQRDLLPGVVTLLQSAEAAAQDGLDRHELTCWADLLEQAYQAHARWALAPAVEVLADISPGQVEHLAAELRERNRDYREDYLDEDLERRRQQRLERYTDRIQGWTGDLSDEQLRLLRQAVSAMPDLSGPWLAYREERQQELLALLRAQADRATLEDYLDAWWVRLDERPDTLVRDADRLRLASLELVLRLDATLSAAQRASFTGRLAELREALQSLTEEQAPLLQVKTARLPCVAVPQSLSN